jgi:hypothetical protein
VNQVEPLSLLLMLAALFASVANLLIAQSRNKIKKSEVDAQAMEMAIKLATGTPGLEQQLRETLVQLHLTHTQLAEQSHQFAELQETLTEQADQIEQLEHERDALLAELIDNRHSASGTSIHP